MLMSIGCVVVLSVLALVVIVRWVVKKRRERRDGRNRLEEDSLYMDAMGVEMKRQIQAERNEKRKMEKENLYEEI